MHPQVVTSPKPSRLRQALLGPVSSRGPYGFTSQTAFQTDPNELYHHDPKSNETTQAASNLQENQVRSSLRQVNSHRVSTAIIPGRVRFTDVEMGKPLLDADNKEANFSSIPPDGGSLAWLHALAGLLVTFNCWGLNTAFGAFQAYYTFGVLPGTAPEKISWIGSIQLSFMFFLGIPVGMAMKYGLFRFLFHGGTFLLVGSVLLTGFCKSWWSLFLIQGVYTGLAMGMIFCSGTMLLMSYFKKKIGLAMALCATGSSLGAICYSVTFRYAVYRIGFPRTMQTIAFIALATMTVANVIVRPRYEAPKAHQVFRLQPFKDVPYWVMTIGLFFTFLGLFFGTVYITSFGIQIVHMTGQDSINLLVVMSAFNLPGRLIIGFISDRYTGPLNMLIPSCVLSALIMFSWIIPQSRNSLFVIASFYGLFSAGIQVLWTSTIHSFSDANPDATGLKSGTTFTIISIACLIGTPLGGALVSARHGGFLYAQAFAGSSLMFGAVLLLFSRYLRVGWGVCRA